MIRAGSLDPDSTDALLLASAVLRQLGSEHEARSLLGAAWTRGVRSPALAEQLSILHLSSGAAAEALETAEEGLAVDRRPSLLLARGLALAAIPSRRTEAVEALGEAIAAGGLPEEARVRLEIAAILVESDRFGEALAELEQARGELSDEPALYYQLAAAKRGLGDRDGAARDMERFEALSEHAEAGEPMSTQVAVALNEAQSLAGQGRLQDAHDRLLAVLDEHPDEAPALALYAKVLFSMGRRAEADVAIARARDILPTHPEYHFLAGLFRMYANLPAEAEEPLRRALALDEELADAHALLAGSLAKQGRPEEALIHFQRAIDLGSDQPDVRLGYASALEDLGRESEAIEQMREYRRLTGSN